MEAHGGRIRAESGGPGQGARFTFTIPVAGEARDSSPGAGRGRAVPSFAPAQERPRILVVDDDPQVLRFVRDALADAGYDALVADDHHDLPALIDTERPHLVLLDLMLPDTDGIELMQRVSQLADQPVIFISAYGRDETIARALSSGVADYIVNIIERDISKARLAAPGWSLLAASNHSAPRLGQAHQRENLACPVDDRLFFVGEASTRGMFATCHGAYLAGRLAVGEIAARLRGTGGSG